LFGGSFDPVHQGHLQIAKQAQRILKLDLVLWLVSPQNPLKARNHHHPHHSWQDRMKGVQHMIRHEPTMQASDLEQKWQTRNTYEFLKKLRFHYPHGQFIWIGGMDTALQFHKWNHWHDITQLIPMAFIARPPALQLIRNCVLRNTHTINHYYLNQASNFSLQPQQCYWILNQKMINLSSTALRKQL
jgi:nicotinate-nucleotide adenylyltransferase